MEDIKLKKLQQKALEEVMNRVSEVSAATASTRVNDLESTHMSAYMDIERTTNSLQHILALKKEASNRMLKCNDELQMMQIAEVILSADNMLKKVLGIN